MNKTKIIWLAGLVVFAGLVAWLIVTPGKADNSKYSGFATCIKDSGATFYGAFWCSHCQNQKALFGSASKLLPYVECSTADGRSQLPICNDAGVTTYPTWEFANGERLTGEISLERLAEATSCVLPE